MAANPSQTSGARVVVILLSVAALVGVLALYGRRANDPARRKPLPMSLTASSERAPEFPDGLAWLNTDRPLALRELRGKVVLLDFWTYCCINCMHVIPDLKRLEQAYPNELVVIGVHSAKFTTERETENIRQAVLRYGLEHPVVNDRDMRVWQSYGVRAWPTLVLVDPAGAIAGYVSGEDVYEPLNRAIGEIVRDFDARGKLDRRPLKLSLERDRAPRSVLSFPGKVLADEASGRLFIADSNHHRILVVSLASPAVREVIGCGEIGLEDGPFEAARFHDPQGMAFDGARLYVADTGNHALRVADFGSRSVKTIAGTGRQAQGPAEGGPARETALNSPWDVLLHEGSLYVAMAGCHQLWVMDLQAGRVRPFAGSGREGRLDGPASEAALAQPSGLATDGRKLFFADSESSSIRAADLRDGRVTTLVGEDLFEFGDRDGGSRQARLQHPIGVAYYRGLLYVADTYNNKIKRIDPATGRTATFAGTGRAGWKDGAEAAFDEPAGLSAAGGKLYVADTNNHVVRVLDAGAGAVETLQIGALAMPPARAARFDGEVVRLEEQAVQPGDVALEVSLRLPQGYELTVGSPTRLVIGLADDGGLKLAEGQKADVRGPRFPAKVALRAREGRTRLHVDLILYYCESEHSARCYYKEVRLVLPVRVDPGAPGRGVAASYTVG